VQERKMKKTEKSQENGSVDIPVERLTAGIKYEVQ
jgi:hypothetical protein